MASTRKEILINRLKIGDFKIEHHCGCGFHWHIDRMGKLDDGCESYERFEGNLLVVDGGSVAQWVRNERREVLVDGMEDSDIPDEIWKKMRKPDYCKRGESPDCSPHASNRRDSLVEWLMASGFELDHSDERNSAKEYTLILRDNGTNREITREEAEKWADSFCIGVATESLVGPYLEEI